jgi:hypothetical protein
VEFILGRRAASTRRFFAITTVGARSRQFLPIEPDAPRQTNMLSREHKGLAFFQPVQLAEGKLSGQAIHNGANGAPILDAAPAAVECKVTSIVEQGDHHIVVGEVTEAHCRPRS